MSNSRLVFRNLNHPASFSGAANVARATGQRYEEVRDALAPEMSFSIHWPRRYHFKRLATVPRSFYSDIQVDLADFQDLSKENRGFRYCLVAVEVLSRRLFAIPVKSKKKEDMRTAFDELLQQLPYHPEVIFSDKGSEFVSLGSYFRDRLILKFHGENPDVKASIAERHIRSLKNRLFRYMSANHTLSWIKPLQQTVHNMNNSVCRTIGMPPSAVNESNWKSLWNRLYGGRVPPLKPGRFKVGDYVRISKERSLFSKSALPGFTDEIFIIVEAVRSNPATFILKDLEGEQVKGKFYREELSLASADTEYRIEKILKTRRRRGRTEHLVRWKGFTPLYDSWTVLS